MSKIKRSLFTYVSSKMNGSKENTVSVYKSLVNLIMIIYRGGHSDYFD